MLKKIILTSDYIKSKTSVEPVLGIVLGTGLGAIIDKIDIQSIVNYKDIPGFPVSTVEGHQGRFIFGKLSEKPVVVMQGRFHFYEGYSMEDVTLPIRVMKLLGVQTLFISNASGGVNPDYEVGDLMILKDHINLIPNPLIGKNIENLGPRFPDMSVPYDLGLIEKALQISSLKKFKTHVGVYAAVTGPTLETPAEYNFLRVIGADTIGMSTAPEVVVARHMDLKCFAVSVITDLGVPGKIKEVTHEEIQRVAEEVQPKLSYMFENLAKKIN
jgi:purine-nucleoside phosphorylase